MRAQPRVTLFRINPPSYSQNENNIRIMPFHLRAASGTRVFARCEIKKKAPECRDIINALCANLCARVYERASPLRPSPPHSSVRFLSRSSLALREKRKNARRMAAAPVRVSKGPPRRVLNPGDVFIRPNKQNPCGELVPTLMKIVASAALTVPITAARTLD